MVYLENDENNIDNHGEYMLLSLLLIFNILVIEYF